MTLDTLNELDDAMNRSEFDKSVFSGFRFPLRGPKISITHRKTKWPITAHLHVNNKRRHQVQLGYSELLPVSANISKSAQSISIPADRNGDIADNCRRPIRHCVTEWCSWYLVTYDKN
jgi:hypothetical protein